MVYDTGTHLTTEIARGGFPKRYGPVLGGNQIAFTELGSGNGDIMVFDLSTNGPLFNVSISGDIDSSPSLPPPVTRWSGTAAWAATAAFLVP